MCSLNQQLVAAYSSFAVADAQQLLASTAAAHPPPPQKPRYAVSTSEPASFDFNFPVCSMWKWAC